MNEEPDQCVHDNNEEVVVQEEQETNSNPIITPYDRERFPLLEMASKPCQIPITPADEEAIVQMDALLDALDEEAAGLAAVQIGFPHCIFLLRNGVGSNGEATNNVYINPRFIHVSHETKRGGEACLSLPGMAANFERPKEVTIEYFDLDGELKTEKFKGFWSRAACHEMDHLGGTLITKHFQAEIAKQPRRTRFGMRLTPHRQKMIAARRAQKKRARKQRKHLKAIGRR